jgi:Glycosyl hydrolase family 63 C-terminal domain
MTGTAEDLRLAALFPEGEGWKKWGPYLSERQWGTVREDYSSHGDAWGYFPHDHARSRAYRWGEDGIAGFSDCKQRLCLGLALWNTQDPLLKERLFGLTNGGGNHGEDVKELYYYLDATPTHSYLKMLYKYPQAPYPYHWLEEENRRRGTDQAEFELIDTGVFDDDRYFDVFVEYAQVEPDDILMRITIENRGSAAARIHVLPQIWFRNTWSWQLGSARPLLSVAGPTTIRTEHATLGSYYLNAAAQPTELLFTNNDSNVRRLWGDSSRSGYWKDGFHERVVNDNAAAVNPDHRGTKAALWYSLEVSARAAATFKLRLSKQDMAAPFREFESLFAQRIREADEFYAGLQKGIENPEVRVIQRQAFAGMIWNKQFYHFNIPQWLNGDPAQPPPPASRHHGRNSEWMHLDNADILSMPDKWEYPWYASWDLAFHCVALAHLDAQFAKEQLVLLTRVWYMHPTGQIPACEWAFDDVNPPVHGWATWRVFQIDRKQRGDQGDLEFLERVFHKLMLNFTWWVNRKDAQGRNVFQGGFLGLDNISVFDRSRVLPTGGHIDQADGTSWMAMYALNLMRIALELARNDRVYEDIATKFFEHFLYIAQAMTQIGGRDGGVGLWDDNDQFFYDVLNLPDGRMQPLKVRSMVGLIPLFAVETLEPELLDRFPDFKRRLEWFLAQRPDLAALVSHWNEEGLGYRRLLSLLRGHRMKQLLKRLLDETEFLSPYGVRALSQVHRDSPYVYHYGATNLTVRYQPAESATRVFGGNSNWRGPIWFPVNFLIIESLQKFHHYYGDDFRIECPTKSGRFVSINDAATEIANRLGRIFLPGENGLRPLYGQYPRLQTDPHFRDYLLFYEYFDGDTGRGVGASHQTGWTGLIAKLLMPRYFSEMSAPVG